MEESFPDDRSASLMAQFDASARPIFVGIGGDSGTGESTLTRAFYRLFGEDRIASICLDDYHSLDRKQRAAVGFTALNPRPNDFYLMGEQLWQLKNGDAVWKPIYDHSDGHFAGPELLEPREVVIVQGLHPFLSTYVREAFDLKVWLDPEPELRTLWKIQRDVARRGYTEDQVQAELEARRPDAEKYIQPQRRHADLVIRFFRPAADEKDMGRLNVRISQRRNLPRLDFDRQLHTSQTVELLLDVLDEDERKTDVIEIDGRITPDEARLVEDNVWERVDSRHHHLRHVDYADIGRYDGSGDGSLHSDPLQLTQLILAHRILSAQKSTLVRVTADQHEVLLGEHQYV